MIKYVRSILIFPTLIKPHRDWKEKSTSSILETSKGLVGKDRIQRQMLFGSNVIDIKGKSVIGLLVDEVSGFVCALI